MAALYSVICAISDSTWSQKPYENFKKEHGFAKLSFKSLAKELELELKDLYLFAKKGRKVYLLRCVETRCMGGLSSTTDTWTAAVIEEKKTVPLIKYPKIMDEIDEWIKKNNKFFEH